MLVVGDSIVYGFGRLNQYARHGSHVGLSTDELPWPLPENGKSFVPAQYRLFASDTYVRPAETAAVKKGSKRGGKGRRRLLWRRRPTACRRIGRSQAVCGRERCCFRGRRCSWRARPIRLSIRRGIWPRGRGRRGGVLQAVAAADGKSIAAYRLDSPPVFDGLIAAGGRLFLSTIDGKLRCFGNEANR